jgi:2-methylcitrate dehydratase PrpD
VTLAGGETFETEVRHARGTLENPLSADELAEKFRDCTAGWMPRQWADSLLGMLNEVDRLPSIVPLARALARPDEARP